MLWTMIKSQVSVWDCLRVDSADKVVPIVDEAEENPAVVPLEEDNSLSLTPP